MQPGTGGGASGVGDAGGGLQGGSLALAIASALLVLGSVVLLFTRLRRKQGVAKVVPNEGKIPKQAEAEKEEEVVFRTVPVFVLFGTQTGTAEGFAKEVSKDLRHKLAGKADLVLADLDEFASSDEEYERKLGSAENLALLLMATYGDGEPTDNAARFCRYLSRVAEESESAEEGPEGTGPTSPRSHLAKLTYAVFGLGNRQYEHFNAVAKAVDKQLSVLGARRLLDLALGDDDQCMEDDFEAWKASATTAVEKKVEDMWRDLNKEQLKAQAVQDGAKLNGSLANGHATNGHVAEEEDEEDDWNAATHGLEVVFHDADSAEAKSAEGVSESFAGGEQWHGHTVTRVPVLLFKELHSKASPRSCLHLELDLSSDPSTLKPASSVPAGSLHYSPGDHVAVFPQNEDADVAFAARMLGLQDKLEAVFSIRVTEGSHPTAAAALGEALAKPMRLDTALKSLVDLHSSPRKAALLLLAAHATDAGEAARLRHLASPGGRQEYMDWVLHSHRSLLQVLEAFPSARPPLSVFLTSLAPRLQPRFYSISSSLRLCPGRLAITCAVVDDVTPGGRAHHGVCSFFFKRKAASLAEAASGTPLPAVATSVPIFLRPSAFRLPPSPATPIVMVGPGTGLAPFRGFLQERMALISEGSEKELGPAVLFFGCRSRDQDYIYSKELAEWQAAGALSELHVAFSREGPSKVYVQHLILEKASEVWHHWHASGGYLYACGDAKHMARDVHSALVAIAQEKEGINAGEAEALIREMQHQGRYQRDVW